ncbi:unnamed protein product [Mycena citricolor]|uniref:SHSP domain-containing protein n=1 Tax=Mycena citricolor TaxID=2018698 RepID=A0AAD2HZK0_9AGAR|nr:unnamed protein product [Mycena citricolor]
MDPRDIDNLNAVLEHDASVSEAIKTQVKEFDKRVRTTGMLLLGIDARISSFPRWSTGKNTLDATSIEYGSLGIRLEHWFTWIVPELLDAVDSVLLSCREITAAIAEAVPADQFWRWKDSWSNSLRSSIYAATLANFLRNRSLLSLSDVSTLLGVQEEWKDRFAIATEDYLHGLIIMSRYAVNSVTMGNYDEPMKISAFVKEIFAGFTMLNLKNDALRRRFDSLKYDLKKIEEDDALPTHGFEDVRKVYRKLGAGLNEIRDISEKDVKAIDDVLERLDVLINLSKQSGSSAPEIQKRNKRPRPPSPSATPVSSGSSSVPASANRVSITLPARSSVGPSGRDNKMRRDAQTRQQLPLQQNRKVVFYQPAGEVIGGEKPIMTESPWILAVVTRSPGGDKSRFDYEVQDPEPQDDGKPGLHSLQNASRCLASAAGYQRAHWGSVTPVILEGIRQWLHCHCAVSRHKLFLQGNGDSISEADAKSCGRQGGWFYSLIIPATKLAQDKEKDKKVIYKLQFADDNNQEHLVSAEWVVDWPGDRPIKPITMTSYPSRNIWSTLSFSPTFYNPHDYLQWTYISETSVHPSPSSKVMSLTRHFINDLRPFFRVLDDPFKPASFVRAHAFFEDRSPLSRPLLRRPPIEIAQSGDSYVVQAELPGVKKENLEVRIGDAGRSLTIEGKVYITTPENGSDSPPSKDTKQDDVTTEVSTEVRETSTAVSTFTRTVFLEQPVDGSNVSAKLQDGILKIQLKRAHDQDSVLVKVD